MARMTKTELAKAVGAILGVEIPISEGGTVTREAWENVLGALITIFEDSR